MVNSAEFAKRIEKILDYYGITATAFSEEIEVNRSTISHLLSGRNKPSLDFIMKVIQHYPEVELYWLLNGKGTFPTDEERQTEQSAASQDSDVIKADLFIASNQGQLGEDEKNATTKPGKGKIERIVVFFKDGSFKSYEN